MSQYKIFTEMSDLLAFAEKDKRNEGAGVAQLNRYPIRFVLFENFVDFGEFVNSINSTLDGAIYTISVDKWLDNKYPDTLITSSQLGREIVNHIKRIPANDVIIAPFSEMARFYPNDNKNNKEFDSLIYTIRGAEPPSESQIGHQRIYIPIIGMQGKMGHFDKDPNINIWELRPQQHTDNYCLIMTPGTTFGVQGMEQEYSTCSTLTEWLQLWEKPSEIRHKIICSSQSLFDNSCYAQPDNAFSYVVCSNAYEFLTKGLGLNFGNIKYKKTDEIYWQELAQNIDVTDFDFDNFVNHRFRAFAIERSIDFIHIWFECENEFDRWLLSAYYQMKFGDSTYLGHVLQNLASLSPIDLYSNLAITIFQETQPEIFIVERRALLEELAKQNITITDQAENKLKSNLQAIAADSERGYPSAIELLTAFTKSEKELIIEWVGNGNMDVAKAETIYPQLYNYLRSYRLQTSPCWVDTYFEEYKRSKISNHLSNAISEFITSQNGSPANFHGWYDEIKTVNTVLNDREDIDVVYWLDGLGLDWLPFIVSIIEKPIHSGVFLNEIFVAASELPTCTANNKTNIQKVAGDRLKPKIGDIDTYAHTPKAYPDYIIEEMDRVEKSVEDVLNKYNGKKIAFVSDHGITYLSQFCQGLDLAGVQSDHSGRVAIRAGGDIVADNNYLILDDKKTMCALSHKSLCAKVNVGLGAHGGATPEEVLVPIIIVSSQKNANNFSVDLINDEVKGTDPIARFKIKGLNSVDLPLVEYNGTTYSLSQMSAGFFESERLNLVDTCKSLIVKIGDSYKKQFAISVSTGAKEINLFDF